MTVGWTFFAGWAVWAGIGPQSRTLRGPIVTSVYLVFAGVAQQVFPVRR